MHGVYKLKFTATAKAATEDT
jgi:hypothetical protein